MRQKLKKLAVKVQNEYVPYENVENMFKSWMGGYYKLMSKSQRRSMIMLYEDLYDKTITIVNKKMVITDREKEAA